MNAKNYLDKAKIVLRDRKNGREYEPWFTENVLDLQFSRRQDGKIKVSVFFTSEGKMSEEKEWETFRFDGIFSERDIRKAVKSLRVFSEAFPYREFEDGRIEGTGWIA